MKRLFLIGGTMGVGKSTVCQILKRRLPACVYLDGDWCWDADPFQVTDETRAMVLDNICHVLQNFLRCSAYENIIFCWVMHQQAIWDAILAQLDLEGCQVITAALTASAKALESRLQGDVQQGLRSPDILQRSVQRLPLYLDLDSLLVDTTDRTPAEVADKIISLADLPTGLRLRICRETDGAALAHLFYETVHHVNARDYTPEQLSAWAPEKRDLAAWNQSFLAHYSLVAELDEQIVGFGDIDRGGYLDRLYVHKAYQRRGIATALCDKLELAASRPITTHASITARPFFAARGYRVMREATAQRQGIGLTYFIMEK